MSINWDFRTKFIRILAVAVLIFSVASMGTMMVYAGTKAVIVAEEEIDIQDEFAMDDERQAAFSNIIDISSVRKDAAHDVIIYCPAMPSSENVTVVHRFSEKKVMLVWRDGRDDYFIDNPLEGKFGHVTSLRLSGNGSDVFFTFEFDCMCECRVNYDNRDIRLDFVPIETDDIIVAVDPGRGGSQTGFMVGDLSEKEITLSVAEHIKKLAKEKPYHVVLLRTGDYGMSLKERMRELEALNADYYIALYAMANTEDERVYGMSAGYNGIYYREGLSNVSFADICLRSICEETKNRGLALNNEYSDDMLHALDIPAVNLYLGYLSNRDEGALLARGEYRVRIARGLINALDEVTR